MKNFFRKIKSAGILVALYSKKFLFNIKKFFIAVKDIFQAFFIKTVKFDDKAVDKFNSLIPDKGNIVDNPRFLNEPSVDLSIIIAAFNAEKYIEECLDSVLGQKTKYKTEVIIVNDGSTDGTAKVIEKYLSDVRVKYLEQENKGQSAARNAAIDRSNGEYLMIVDSDDVLLDGAIDVLLDTAKSTDSEIVEGGIERFYNELKVERPEVIKNKSYSNDKNSAFILRSFGYSWAKVYKRELWEKVRYPGGYIFEDVISKFVLKRIANKVTYTNYKVYGYRFHGASSSHGGNSLKKLDSVLVLPKIFDICAQNGVARDNTFYMLALNHIGLLNYNMSRKQSEEIKRAVFAVMREQLKSIQDVKKRLPLMFKVLDKSIICGDFDLWQKTAADILRYGYLKKYREIN